MDFGVTMLLKPLALALLVAILWLCRFAVLKLVPPGWLKRLLLRRI